MKYIVLESNGQTMTFTDLRTAIIYVMNADSYCRLYESKEIFNSDDFDVTQIQHGKK